MFVPLIFNSTYMKSYPNIKALRDKHNYKQIYVARFIGLEQPEYSRLENGKRIPRAFEVQKLCELYAVAADIILDGENAVEDLVLPYYKGKDLPDDGPEDSLEHLLLKNIRLMERACQINDTNDQILKLLLKQMCLTPLESGT
jgi:transcriptional regulator with XRE-family HTH domain